VSKHLVEEFSAESWEILGEQWKGLHFPPVGEGYAVPMKGVWADEAWRFTVAADVADKDDEEARTEIKKALRTVGDLDDDVDELREWGKLGIVQAVRRRALREVYGV
jgi:hypothetical protein